MIDTSTFTASKQFFDNAAIQQPKPQIEIPTKDLEKIGNVAKPGQSFDNMVGNLVKDVAEKGRVAQVETNKVLLGESDNIHQSMIAMQESGTAFSMMVEVRNKLVTAYQELIKMPV
tara:strand:+ start:1328 stop:1675 length:348 start_codon:yes stop_codon:yes gene_type:complete